MFELSLPPALNRAYRAHTANSGRPYLYKTTEAKRWQRESLLMIQAARKTKELHTGKIKVAMKLYLKRDRDIDSSHKLLLDTLEFARVIENDRQIVELHTEKVYPSLEEKVIVEVRDVDSRDAESTKN